MTEFIMENNIWLIIFGVLIFMAMIGYTAEKKKESKKRDKEEKKSTKDKEIKIEKTSDIVVDDPIEPTTVPNILNISEMPSAETSTQDVNEDIPTNPVELDNLMNPESNDTVSMPEEVPSTITETGEDLTVPLEETSMDRTVDATSIENIAGELSLDPSLDLQVDSAPVAEDVSPEAPIESATISEDITLDQQLSMTEEASEPNVVENEAVEETQSEPAVTSNDLGMDDISYLFTENKKEETSSPEDVWKF